MLKLILASVLLVSGAAQAGDLEEKLIATYICKSDRQDVPTVFVDEIDNLYIGVVYRMRVIGQLEEDQVEVGMGAIKNIGSNGENLLLSIRNQFVSPRTKSGKGLDLSVTANLDDLTTKETAKAHIKVLIHSRGESTIVGAGLSCRKQ